FGSTSSTFTLVNRSARLWNPAYEAATYLSHCWTPSTRRSQLSFLSSGPPSVWGRELYRSFRRVWIRAISHWTCGCAVIWSEIVPNTRRKNCPTRYWRPDKPRERYAARGRRKAADFGCGPTLPVRHEGWG